MTTSTIAPDKKQLRRMTILQAASDVFLESGYERTSIDAVIERIGGSKRTIYNEFGSKQGLFAALIVHTAEQALEALAPSQMGGHDLRSTLQDFGQKFMSVIMSPVVLALYRAIVHESVRFPELAQIYWDNGPGSVTAHLAKALEKYRGNGEITVDDSATAADIFIGMIRGNIHQQVIIGLRSPPCDKETHSIVKTKVNIFMEGILTRR